MRLALHQAGEVGTRAGRILMAERSLSALGLIDKHPTEDDQRLEHVDVLATYDALVTDDPDPAAQIQAALTAGINCAVWDDADAATAEYGPAFLDSGLTLLTGCNLGSGIAFVGFFPAQSTYTPFITGFKTGKIKLWNRSG